MGEGEPTEEEVRYAAARRVAREITPEDLEALFCELANANSIAGAPAYDERRAALAALDAVTTFLRRREMNVQDHFAKILDLLHLEISNSGAPDAGNILPPYMRGQKPERGRRDSVNYCKAAVAFTVDRLAENSGGDVAGATRVVAEILRSRHFPVSDYADPKHLPTLDDVVKTVGRLRDTCRAGGTTAARMFAKLVAELPLPVNIVGVDDPEETLPLPSGKMIVEWLENQLAQMNYHRR